MPILDHLDIDDDLPIGATTWGDKLALDTLQRAANRFDGDNLDVASGGSQHLETEIREIAQSPPMRNELSKFAKRRARRKQQKDKVTEEEDEPPLGNTLSYEAPNDTKHIRPYESRLDIAWRL